MNLSNINIKLHTQFTSRADLASICTYFLNIRDIILVSDDNIMLLS